MLEIKRSEEFNFYQYDIKTFVLVRLKLSDNFYLHFNMGQ